MSKSTQDKDAAAIRLALALKRLLARLSEEAPASSTSLSFPQLSILQFLHVNGPVTAAALAVAEHITQQAITQSIIPLKSEGFIEPEPDPDDGRKTLLRLTDAGNQAREATIAERNAWLVQAIDATIKTRERPALFRAIELLERLADVED